MASTADGHGDLLSRIDSASSVSEPMAKMFNDQTELLRTMDRQRGAAAMVDQMSGHLSALEDTLNFAVLPSARRPVALARADASTHAARQAIDSGAVERAWRHYELAKRAARDAEEPMYLTKPWASRRTCSAKRGGRHSPSTCCGMLSAPSGKPVPPASGPGCTPRKPRCARTPTSG
ncbi:hypothetical protein [Streptomyces sp. NPDC048200]|uniref:hypothetical protein n=1 Tax=Streptomyces sp. NPDC048200 TaxID=3365512 RepID=UPI00371205D3